MDRALVVEYEQLIERILQGLSSANHDTAVELLSLPEKFTSPEASARAVA